jgi:CRISPR-associated endonuclease/helicase Cas3
LTDLFAEQFRALVGFPPYRWQTRLYEALVANESYDALDLPTGLGKTSIIPIWLLARAAGASLPRRLIYVVDRRAVVDQATAVADEIANRLAPSATGIAAELRRALGLSGRATLPVSTLRGQHADNRLWLEDPGATSIVVGTVDMIGSRLLFEGYAVSRRMRPVHAGLVGVDSLIVVDEAHLVPPFEALVREAATMAHEDWTRAPGRLASATRVMSLSATGRQRRQARSFRLVDDDLEDPPVLARLRAVKRVKMLPDASPADLAGRLADQAWSYGEGGRRVIVFCNSRKTAQAVHAELASRVAKEKERFGKGLVLTELLVGERRYRERLRMTGDPEFGLIGSPVFARFKPGAAVDPEGRPAFLVATSAGEVGIDLDADDLVCDLVAWERMVQRFGRVNRRQTPGEARIVVIPVAKEKEAEDEIGDADLARFRAPFDSPFWPMGEDGTKDASPFALRQLKLTPELQHELDAASTPAPLRPPLRRPTLEAWSLTMLEQHTGRPKVQPWLRGWAKVDPQTTVIWRRLFPLRAGEEGQAPTRELRNFFESAAPPHFSEALDAPSWRVAQLLRDRANAWRKAELKTGGEQSAVEQADDRDSGERKHQPVIVVLTPDIEVVEILTASRLAELDADGLTRLVANGTVIIDTRLGGLDSNGLLDSKATTEPDTIDTQPESRWELPLNKTVARRITFGDRPAAVDGWRLDDFQWAASDGDDADGLWVELWRGIGPNPGDPAIGGKAQALVAHHRDTGIQARRIAASLGLTSPWRELLIATAEAHDLGKDRKIWQDAMGAPLGADRPYAKTTGGGDGRRLNGYRHEFGSLRDVLRSPPAYLPLAIADDPDLTDLALHLILAHHGWARPSIKAYDPDQIPSQSEPLAREAALRFARLQARWGPWGLAWWEALVRAADWAASRELNEPTRVSETNPLIEEVVHG